MHLALRLSTCFEPVAVHSLPCSVWCFSFLLFFSLNSYRSSPGFLVEQWTIWFHKFSKFQSSYTATEQSQHLKDFILLKKILSKYMLVQLSNFCEIIVIVSLSHSFLYFLAPLATDKLWYLTWLSLCSGVIIAVNVQENRVSISLKQSRLPEEHKHLRLVNVHYSVILFFIVAR